MITALIFDFDGLILETEEPVYQSWKEIYQDYNKEISLEKWLTIIGMTEEAFNPLEELEYQSRNSAAAETAYPKAARSRDGACAFAAGFTRCEGLPGGRQGNGIKDRPGIQLKMRLGYRAPGAPGADPLFRYH